MAAPDGHGAGPVVTGSGIHLRRVKEAELDFDRRLAEVRADGERAVAAIRAERDARLKAAHEATERRRETALAEARREAETEAERARSDAEREADRIERAFTGASKIPKDRLLAALFEGVLGRADDGRKSA